MADIDELIRRLEVMEQEGSAAAITRLEHRLRAVEDKQERHNTALGKVIMIGEETRLRVSEVEKRLDKIEADIAGLRKDMPGIVAEAMRAVMKGGEEE